jgi:hypothetical protein
MHNTEPAISQDAAGHGPSQQPDAARLRARTWRMSTVVTRAIQGSAQAGDRSRGHWPGCYRRGQRRVIVSDSRAGGSMVMAVLPGVALLCNLGNLFVVRASNRSRPGPQ